MFADLMVGDANIFNQRFNGGAIQVFPADEGDICADYPWVLLARLVLLVCGRL